MNGSVAIKQEEEDSASARSLDPSRSSSSSIPEVPSGRGSQSQDERTVLSNLLPRGESIFCEVLHDLLYSHRPSETNEEATVQFPDVEPTSTPPTPIGPHFSLSLVLFLSDTHAPQRSRRRRWSIQQQVTKASPRTYQLLWRRWHPHRSPLLRHPQPVHFVNIASRGLRMPTLLWACLVTSLFQLSLLCGDTFAVLTDEARQEQAARIFSFHAAPLAAIRIHA